MITRFCPSIYRDMHLGHIIAMFLTYEYTRLKKGEMLIRVVFRQPELSDSEAEKRNIEIMKLLLPNVPIMYLNYENMDLLLWTMRDWLKEKRINLKKEHLTGPADAFLGPIFDKLTGVDTIIRGKEWSGDVDGEQPQMGILTNCFLESICDYSIDFLYHPVLCMEDGKISKSACDKKHHIRYWLDKGVTREKFIEWYRFKTLDVEGFLKSNLKTIPLEGKDFDFLVS